MWSIFQEIRRSEHRLRQDSIEADTERIRGDSFELSKQLAKMALVNQALYELVKEKVGITDEEFRHKIREVDSRDGVEDGKLKASPLRCPKCEIGVTAGALSYSGCGATVAPKYPFES